MNKEIMICAIIIFFVISLDIITKNYTNEATKTINDSLYSIKEELLKDNLDQDSEKEKINEIMDVWRTKYKVLAYFIEHDELEKVETELTALLASAEVEQYKDGIENLDRCIFILNHIKEKYNLKIKNIF